MASDHGASGDDTFENGVLSTTDQARGGARPARCIAALAYNQPLRNPARLSPFTIGSHRRIRFQRRPVR